MQMGPRRLFSKPQILQHPAEELEFDEECEAQMDIEKIEIIIKQLKQLEKESFSPQNDELFTGAKNKLIENAPAGLKSKLFVLDYCNCEDIFREPVANIPDVKKLILLYEEELFSSKFLIQKKIYLNKNY